MPADETDAKHVLESIREADYQEYHVSAELLAAVYDVEHEKQFEDERGQVLARLRDLITEAVQEES